jgi:hypothetical protein
MSGRSIPSPRAKVHDEETCGRLTFDLCPFSTCHSECVYGTQACTCAPTFGLFGGSGTDLHSSEELLSTKGRPLPPFRLVIFDAALVLRLYFPPMFPFLWRKQYELLGLQRSVAVEKGS